MFPLKHSVITANSIWSKAFSCYHLSMSLPLSFTPAKQTLMILLTFTHIWLLYQMVFLFSLWNNISATCLIPSPQLKEVVWSFKLGSNPLTPFKRNLRVSPNVSRVVWRSSISAHHSGSYFLFSGELSISLTTHLWSCSHCVPQRDPKIGCDCFA